MAFSMGSIGGGGGSAGGGWWDYIPAAIMGSSTLHALLEGTDEGGSPKFLGPGWQAQGQRQMAAQTMPMAKNYLSNLGQPYPGEMTTDYEKQGLGLLGGYLGSDLTQNPLYQQAQSELEKTFNNEYDPVGSEYYGAYRTAVLRELQEAKDRLAASTSARDKYFGGGRIQTEGELEEDAMTNLAMTLGQMFENERARKLETAVPLAQNLMGAGEAATMNRVGLSQSAGGLEFAREYGDYLRQMQELGIPLEVALQMITNKNEYYMPSEEPGTVGRMLPLIYGAAGSYYGMKENPMGMMGGGGGGGASGGWQNYMNMGYNMGNFRR